MNTRLNISVPEELAAGVREAGLPISKVCTRALVHALQRVRDPEVLDRRAAWHEEQARSLHEQAETERGYSR